MSTDWLNVLKYLGTATAAMYAVYQLFLDYRDKRSGTPSDPERHAKRLTIALGFVAVGALISLFGDIGKDLRDARVKIVSDSIASVDRNQRIREAANIVKNLGRQLAEVRTVQKVLDRQQQELKKQSALLDSQRDLQERLRRELAVTAAQTSENIRLSSSVLNETMNRADAMEVEVLLSVNPIELQKLSSPNPLLESFAVEALDTAFDTAPNVAVERGKAVYQMRSKIGEVFKHVLQNWEVWVAFGRDSTDDQHDMFFSRRGADGVQAVTVVGVDSNRFRGFAVRGILCKVRYSFVPNHADGYRTFGDFSGKFWKTWVQVNSSLVEVRSVSLYLGSGATRSRVQTEPSYNGPGYDKWVSVAVAELP